MRRREVEKEGERRRGRERERALMASNNLNNAGGKKA